MISEKHAPLGVISSEYQLSFGQNLIKSGVTSLIIPKRAVENNL
jgi:hypothetical protein